MFNTLSTKPQYTEIRYEHLLLELVFAQLPEIALGP